MLGSKLARIENMIESMFFVLIVLIFFKPNMRVFALQSYVFYKYVFVRMEYVVSFFNVFSYLLQTSLFNVCI